MCAVCVLMCFVFRMVNCHFLPYLYLKTVCHNFRNTVQMQYFRHSKVVVSHWVYLICKIKCADNKRHSFWSIIHVLFEYQLFKYSCPCHQNLNYLYFHMRKPWTKTLYFVLGQYMIRLVYIFNLYNIIVSICIYLELWTFKK